MMYYYYYGNYSSLSAALAACTAYALMINPIPASTPAPPARTPPTSTPCWIAPTS